jgi:hypothetical protein
MDINALDEFYFAGAFDFENFIHEQTTLEAQVGADTLNPTNNEFSKSLAGLGTRESDLALDEADPWRSLSSSADSETLEHGIEVEFAPPDSFTEILNPGTYLSMTENPKLHRFHRPTPTISPFPTCQIHCDALNSYH